ncbi:nicotinamide/nicotinic acid mononucleotide adenylyltransferase 3-like [Convolutriloba macropyga]|uniref:nicotinamide/nicotinic acid mononucleotide adenylyltransferase 3-like n=1 Tax=Convolutriloba macropyga TaxID=536237 RepID=UPI003F528DF8
MRTGVSRMLIALIEFGCFNPPTNMHLRLFETAKFALEKAGHTVKVGIMSPAHDKYGKKGLIAAKHRVEMCQLACQSSRWLRCEDWETIQEDWSRTSDVLDHYSAQLQTEFPGINCRLLCGTDLLLSFNTPDLWSHQHLDNILGTHGIVCIQRKGYDATSLLSQHPVVSKHKDNILFVQADSVNDVSSTLVRDLISKGSTAKYLVPDQVNDYICQNDLYLTQ